MKRWIVRILVGLVSVAIVAVAVIYVLSNRVIYARHAFREHPVPVSTDSATLARGEHIARLRCYGCHDDSLRGQVFVDEWPIGRLVAPNLPEKLKSLTDAEFAGFMRSGVRKDGTSPFEMPPPGFYHMSDVDLGALVSYIRSLPVPVTSHPKDVFRLGARIAILAGAFKTAVNEFDTTVARVGDDPAWATTRQGEYLARVICSECHGARLTGEPERPSLSGAAGYSLAEFLTLLRTGTPRSSTTTLGLMGQTARSSLHYLTDLEISALHEYLSALPAAGVPR